MVAFDGVRRGRALAVAVAVAVLGGALLAPIAQADDGAAPLAELTAPAAEAVEAAAELLATVPVDTEVIEGESPAVAEDAHPAEGSTSEATAPAETAASEPETGDTMAENGDTAADIGPQLTAAPAPATVPAASSTTPTSPPAPIALAPTNVNISVRIDSAGDDGPVTQINVSVAPSPADEGTSGVTGGSAGRAAPAAAAPRPSSEAGVGASEGSVIDWIWSCLGLAAISKTVSPSESADDHDPLQGRKSSNCGGNMTVPVSGMSQYQTEISAQYLPINMNVSIRISSPGDNGPVTQTNLVVALGGGWQQTSAVAYVAAGAAAVAIQAHVPVMTVTFAASSAPSVAEAVEGGVISAPVLDEAAVELGQAGAYPRPASIVFVESDPAVLHPSGGQRWPMPVAVPVLGVAGLDASGVGFGPGASSTEAEGRPSRGAPAGRRTPTRPPRASVPEKSIVLLGSAPAGTSVAPASGGSSAGGGLPVFLLFPLIAVMLDLARRVVATCLTWPSGHRARMPDTPG